jgi:hypothetical protein
MMRTTIKAGRTGLTRIAIVTGVAGLLWLWVSVIALKTDGLSPWFVFPIALMLASVFGWVCLWALRRRVDPEPAVIIDEVGIFDNVSILHAGRVRWHDMEKIWLTGPQWMRLVCILPDNMRPYLEQQDEVRGLLMRLNMSVMGAPVIIPLAALDMPQDEAWEQMALVASTLRMTAVTSGLAADS